MEFLCDVHISIKVAKSIEDLGYKYEHVNRILNKWNTTDAEITSYVDDKYLILMTKDQDFRNSFLLYSKPNKLIKIDLGNISNANLSKIIKTILPFIEDVNRNNKKFMIEVDSETASVIIKE
jgi:predicted nuclease of predicted toxin-antitoxin system